MKTSFLKNFIWVFGFAFLQCNPGNKIEESTGNDFQKLLKKFEKDPRNEKNIAQLNAAYIRAHQLHLARIHALGKTTTASGTESAANEYASLQQLFISIAEIPGLTEKIHPQDFSMQIDSLKKILPGQLKDEADFLLKEGDKVSCQKSYYNLVKLKTYQPGNSLIDDKIQQSLKCGSINIIIHDPEVDSKISHYNTEINDFSTKISNTLRQNILSPFIKIETKTSDPDESVFIYFKNFSIDVVNKETNSRDIIPNSNSAQAGRRSSGSVTLPSSGTMISTHIISTSKADLVLEVVNKDGTIVDKQDFNALYEWTDDINTYRGDSRSLTSGDRALLRNQNKSMPSESILISDLLKQLYEKVLGFLRMRYIE